MSNSSSGHPDSPKSLLKSTYTIGLGTLSSRILGFVRDMILAKFLGTGVRADAFFVAFRIPNLFRDLVGEGATNSAVVPVLSEYYVKKSKEEFWQFVSVVLILAMMVLSVLTILGMVLAPWVVKVMAPGFMADPQKLDLTINLTRIMFPYLILIGLTAYSMAILYTFRSFSSPAYSPCLLNVAMIISAVLSTKFLAEPVYGLAIGVLVGGVWQLWFQWQPMRAAGLKWYPPKTLRHPGALQVGQLLLPRLFGAGVYQLTVFIDTFCASIASVVGPGGISAIYYANRIVQFPMGVFSLALASAVLPSLSGMASKNDMQELKRTLVFSLENNFFILFPSSIIIMLLANPIIRVLFERGEFDVYSTNITTDALFFYTIGLFSFGAIKILVTTFHALQDTKTPVKVAALCLLINATLNFVLMYPLKIGGIALASSIAATLDFLILYYVLDRRLGGIDSGLQQFVLKILLASLVTAGTVHWGWHSWGIPSEVIRLAVVGTMGFVVYGITCLLLKVEPAKKIWLWIMPRVLWRK